MRQFIFGFEVLSERIAKDAKFVNLITRDRRAQS